MQDYGGSVSIGPLPAGRQRPGSAWTCGEAVGAYKTEREPAPFLLRIEPRTTPTASVQGFGVMVIRPVSRPVPEGKGQVVVAGTRFRTFNKLVLSAAVITCMLHFVGTRNRPPVCRSRSPGAGGLSAPRHWLILELNNHCSPRIGISRRRFYLSTYRVQSAPVLGVVDRAVGQAA